MNKDIIIMDVTLRDGSYANHFQFSLAQQKIITSKLEELGFEYIEIGHGMGLNASSPQNGVALHTDAEYLRMAQETLKKAKYGMFCIPGIARLDDINLARDMGASFIRVGTNIIEVDNSKPYIERAKKLGLTVMSNYMKVYAETPEYVAQQALKSESYGSDCVYVVDSAGCMLPCDIEEMFNAIRPLTSVKIGFHGHDNLGLAMTNALKAAELGFDFVDCTLQGMGRSAGNTPTELFAICAEKLGYNIHVDIPGILNLSKKYVYPMTHRYNNIDVMCGVVGMHTGFLGSVSKVSGKYGVDPMTLMDEYAKYSKVRMEVDKLEELATQLPEDLDSYSTADFNGYFGYGQI